MKAQKVIKIIAIIGMIVAMYFMITMPKQIKYQETRTTTKEEVVTIKENSVKTKEKEAEKEKSEKTTYEISDVDRAIEEMSEETFLTEEKISVFDKIANICTDNSFELSKEYEEASKDVINSYMYVNSEKTASISVTKYTNKDVAENEYQKTTKAYRELNQITSIDSFENDINCLQISEEDGTSCIIKVKDIMACIFYSYDSGYASECEQIVSNIIEYATLVDLEEKYEQILEGIQK